MILCRVALLKINPILAILKRTYIADAKYRFKTMEQMTKSSIFKKLPIVNIQIIAVRYHLALAIIQAFNKYESNSCIFYFICI